MKKLPPIQKIHEAYSAIADNRIVMGEHSAKVASSDYKKVYKVTWDGNLYTSNDNGSYWQGYAGYPMIAVLMLQEKLPLNRNVADNFKGINWTELNAKHKADYEKAVGEVIDGLQEKGADTGEINVEINNVYEKIKSLNIETKRSSTPPPKSS